MWSEYEDPDEGDGDDEYVEGDGDDEVYEHYEPHLIDLLIPGQMVLILMPDKPMFRYRILLTVKEPGTEEGDGRHGSNIQRSWPSTDVPRLVYEYGGLDNFLRAQCRTMLLDLFDNMFDTNVTDQHLHRVMSYTGQWYLSGHIHPSTHADIEGIPQTDIYTLAAVSFLGKVGELI